MTVAQQRVMMALCNGGYIVNSISDGRPVLVVGRESVGRVSSSTLAVLKQNGWIERQEPESVSGGGVRPVLVASEDGRLAMYAKGHNVQV